MPSVMLSGLCAVSVTSCVLIGIALSYSLVSRGRPRPGGREPGRIEIGDEDAL